MKSVLKLVAALAAIGGIIALLLRYTEKLKAMRSCQCDCGCDCRQTAEVVEDTQAVEEQAEVDPAEQEAPAEGTTEETPTDEDFVD